MTITQTSLQQTAQELHTLANAIETLPCIPQALPAVRMRLEEAIDKARGALLDYEVRRAHY